MKIGIDISQIAYQNTGVANYLKQFVRALLSIDSGNQYILFYSSLRIKPDFGFLQGINNPRVEVKIFHFPQTFLNFIWNSLHVFPIEKLIGSVDLFITSDWVEPPSAKARKATIIYDLIINKYQKETDDTIIKTQNKRLEWVKIESDVIFCISQSTLIDVKNIYNIDKSKLFVIYPGITL
jgi:hypothetical protein